MYRRSLTLLRIASIHAAKDYITLLRIASIHAAKDYITLIFNFYFLPQSFLITWKWFHFLMTANCSENVDVNNVSSKFNSFDLASVLIATVF